MASAILCPACGAHNRPNWEYCARCGEELEGLSATQVMSQQGTLAGQVQATEAAPAEDSGSLYLVLMLAILVGTVALACREVANQPTPPPASPGVFTFGGQPTAPPSPEPAAPGNASLQEARERLARGDTAGAIQALQQAAADDPNCGDCRNLLGRTLWSAGQREEALAAYADAARLDPGYRLSYAQALETMGRGAEAAAEFEALLTAQPGNPGAEEGLSRVYYNRGDYASALPLLEAVAARTADPVVLQQLAYAAEKTGDTERAISTYQAVLAAQPQADVARGRLAESLLAAGRGDEAVAVLQEGLQRTPQAPLLQRGLGSLLERSGRTAEAAAAYREYAKLAPNAPDIAEIQARAARLEAAAKGGGS